MALIIGFCRATHLTKWEQYVCQGVKVTRRALCKLAVAYGEIGTAN